MKKKYARRGVSTRRIMPTIIENFTHSSSFAAFASAISNATEYGSRDVPLLRAYFLEKQRTPSFLFEWLDKLERCGLTRDEVLTVVYGDQSSQQDEKTTTPKKKRKYTRRLSDEETTPGATPVASPSRPSNRAEPVTPKVPVKRKTTGSTPPAKPTRQSKKETQVIYDSDDEEDDED